MRALVAVLAVTATVSAGAVLTADAQDPVQPATWEQVAPRFKEYTIVQYEAGAISAEERGRINRLIDQVVYEERRGRPFPWPR